MWLSCCRGDAKGKDVETITDFDPTKSTEDNFSMEHFTGAHATIRPLLDYTYHKKYVPSRERMQDELIDKICSQCQCSSGQMLPWVVFTAGAMGAGKGYVTRWMEKSGYFPLKNFIIVDPDAIRQELPEWKKYCEFDPLTAGARTQKEAGCIAEILGHRGLRDRQNVVFDGSLRDARWYTEFFRRLRVNFPGVRIMIMHIVAERSEVLERARERAKLTGRVVPERLLEESMSEVPKSVDKLAPHADFVCRIVNRSGEEPYPEHVPAASCPPKNIPMTWKLISLLWRDLDLDHDGELSAEEVQAALAKGLISSKTLETIDTNCDGAISRDELAQAKRAAKRSATLVYQ